MRDSLLISQHVNKEILLKFFNRDNEVLSRAQNMLLMNKILYPNYLTYNNYASFVLQETHFWLYGLSKNDDVLQIEKDLMQALEFKKNRYSMYALSQLYYGLEDYSGAEEYLVKAMHLHNETALNQHLMGCILYKQKRRKEAKDYFVKALALCVDDDDKEEIECNISGINSNRFIVSFLPICTLIGCPMHRNNSD